MEIFTPTKDRGITSQCAPVYDERFSVNIQGILDYMKFFQHCQRDSKKRQAIFDLEKVAKRLKNSEVSKRQDLKRCLIGTSKQETFGFKLERKSDYEIPVPIIGNNFYKNHGMVNKKTIYR